MAKATKTLTDGIARMRAAAERARQSLDADTPGTLFPEGVPAWSGVIPHQPTEKQRQFLSLLCKEALYGGAAGGGKSDALLMAALMFVDVPGYAAIIFQRSLTDFTLAGALIDRAEEWLGGTSAIWDGGTKTWTFPSGATLTFGYIKNYSDALRYKSSEFQFIGFEELTRFLEREYRYLFSRLRRRLGLDVPLRMRGVTNPGDRGHEWVKQRFITEGKQNGRVFITARASENPYLDQDEYNKSLEELDAATRKQLRDGNWDVRTSGGLFKREWFGRFTNADDIKFKKIVRFWDLASTAPAPGKDPDWTAGALVGFAEGRYYVLDVRRMRGTPGEVEKFIKKSAIEDRSLYG